MDISISMLNMNLLRLKKEMSDESIYMYRIQAGSPEHIGPYQLIGKNKVMPVVEDDEE